MAQARVKLFICHHPDQLLLFRDLIRIVRAQSNCHIVIIKINHPFFKKFDFTPFIPYFDKIIELPFVEYEKNILIGILHARLFKKKLNAVFTNLMQQYSKLDVFLFHSGWFPINLLLDCLKKHQDKARITRFGLWGQEDETTKTDVLRTVVCRLYQLFVGGFPVVAITTESRVLENFVYRASVPGEFAQLVSPFAVPEHANADSQRTIPYPLLQRPENTPQKKDVVLFFGNGDILDTFSEYIRERARGEQMITDLFTRLANRYHNCTIYYKPHPNDKNPTHARATAKPFVTFDNQINAEMLIDRFRSRIRAVYTISSSAVALSSFLGIPSYTTYRCLFNDKGKKRFDAFFQQRNIVSPALIHIESLEAMGEIDGRIESHVLYIDPHHPLPIYQELLRLS